MGDFIPTKDKIKMLKKTKNYLLRQIKKGVDLNKELETVSERLSFYRKLDKEERRLKGKFSKK